MLRSVFRNALGATAPSPGFASLVVFLSASIWGLYWVPLRYLSSQGIDGGWAVAMLNLPAGLALILSCYGSGSSIAVTC